MIKKILCTILMIMASNIANANIHIEGTTARKIILSHIDSEHQVPALQEYNVQLKSTGNYTMSAMGLYKVCTAAGWDIAKPDGKTKCENFVKALVEKSDYKYYEVCGNDKGKSGGTEYCIDNVFGDIEVQIAQAKNLAREYARVKYNDDIVCDTKTRSDALNISDYVKCVSKLKPVYYEFKFDDAKESNANAGQFVKSEFGRGLCSIYGGKPENVVSKPLAIRKTDFSVECKYNDCNKLNGNLIKWKYSAESNGSDSCLISWKEEAASELSQDYYIKFDGKNLAIYHQNTIIESWPAVSGRGKAPDDPKPTICQLPRYQSCKNIGPTPSGKYYINQNDIQFAGNITIGNFNSNSLLANKDGTSWGEARVILHPYPETNMYGREPDMYIHGGKYPGSAGCIDLTTRISEFMNWFIEQTESPYLTVIVDYGTDVSSVCTNTKECDANGKCSCECISNASDCEYI